MVKQPSSRLLPLLLLCSSLTAVSAGDWPQWLGPNRDARLSADEKLPGKLPAEMKPLWRIPVGGGFASPIAVGQKVIFVDDQGGQETVHLLDAATGREIWKNPFAPSFTDEFGTGPRCTPFVDNGRVHVQSCRGEFQVLNLTDGKAVWKTRYDTDFGAKFYGASGKEGAAARRGNNGAGVLSGNILVLPVGNPDGATLAGLDPTTGSVLWKSGTDETAYSSLRTATLAGVPQVVAFTADALVGVDPKTGRELWRVPLKTNAKRHAGTPVIYHDTVIVNSHTIGLVATRIVRDGTGVRAEPAWANRDLKINLATPVVVDDYLYSHGAGKELVCVDARTGALQWSAPGFGDKYSAVLSDGQRLLVVTDAGELVLAQVDPKAYRELGRAQIAGKNWSFPAISNGKLFLRDNRELLCYSLFP